MIKDRQTWVSTISLRTLFKDYKSLLFVKENMYVKVQLGKADGRKYNMPKRAFIKMFTDELWMCFMKQ